MNTAAVAFGSNLAPVRHIKRARALVHQRYGIVAASPFVVTAPIGPADQPDFLNGVVLVRTAEARTAVERGLKAIEAAVGRRRDGDRYGPRVIDLDLVVWNGRVVHEDVRERDFVRDGVLAVLPDLAL
jgi:2-amino-4-hydroxy-6-hydroxymethyldihydropteridine diphosphokinase